MRDRHRKAADLRRKHGRRPPRERILIVCEGEQTERNYFEEIREAARLSTATIKTVPSHLGTNPENVVKSAEARSKRMGRAFDRIYAVFDRDDHQGYANALDMAATRNGKLLNADRKPTKFQAIPSVPCFELWLLIHFAQTQGPIHRDDVVARLKRHWPEYTKNIPNAYGTTKDRLEAAKLHAEHTRQQVGALPGTDCYTDIDQLVDVLLSLNT